MESISRGEVTIGITITATATVVAVVVEDRVAAISNGRVTNNPMLSITMASSTRRTKVSITSLIRVCLRSRMVSPTSTCLRDRLRFPISSSRVSQSSNIMRIRMNRAIIDRGSLEGHSSLN